MKVLIIGAHGKVGQHLIREMVTLGIPVRAMVRQQTQVAQLEQAGVELILADLEEDFSRAYQGIDHVVFTAGSGSRTGPEKTIDIDQNAAIRAIDLAKQFQINRFIMVSAQGARDPEAPSSISHYFKAKSMADQHLINSGQPFTIFRPGRLSDEKSTAMVELKSFIEHKGVTSRENLAIAIAKSLTLENTTNKIIEIFDGNVPVDTALKSI